MHIRNKFSSIKTADGFPSKLESSVHQQLLLREKAGEIRDIRRQHSFRFPCGPSWKIDFSFIDCASGETVFCEAKGAELETYRLKKRMYGGCPVLESSGTLEVWKGDYKRPKLNELVIPKKGETHRGEKESNKENDQEENK